MFCCEGQDSNQRISKDFISNGKNLNPDWFNDKKIFNPIQGVFSMFKKFSKFYSSVFIAAVSGLFLFPSQAYAYLDPGTGSMILQGIIGGLAAVAVVAKIYWHRLLGFFGLKKDSSPDDRKPSIHAKSHDTTTNPEKFSK